MSYATQRYFSITVAVLLGLIGAVQLANADTLGITPRLSAWLGIASVGLGILAGFLPRIQGRTTDPESLADRVWDLKPDERQAVASDLADRAAREEHEQQAAQAIAALRRRGLPPAQEASQAATNPPERWPPAPDYRSRREADR